MGDLTVRNLSELWKYRALIWALVGRHLASRYRGSVLGFLWSFLNPLGLMLIYALVFQYYIRFNGVPHYAIFVFCGLLPWLWATSGLSEEASSIVASGHLITKSMFPAHLLPVVAVITTMVHFLLSLPLLFIFMWAAGLPLHPTLIALPALIFVQFLFLVGIGLALSSLNVLYRDVQHILGNLLTFLFFLCPIVYPATNVPPRYRFSLDLNPIAQFTTFYHDLILEGVWPQLDAVLYVTACSLLMVIVGNLVFDRYRETFAELL